MKKLELNWVTDSIGDQYKKWKKGDTVLIQAQTGTGKTWFIKNVLLDHLDSYERLLFVCNRTNLKRQLKKDLLKKYNQPIPETLNELDSVKTINDKVTITSYHAISKTIQDGLYDKDAPMADFSLYDYIVFDECHFIFSDGSFNNKTRFCYEKIIYEQHYNIIRIFISATMMEIREPIIHCVESNKEKGFGLDNFDIHEYSTGVDYSYVKPRYFDKIATIINLVKNDKTNDKWLIFVSDLKNQAVPIMEALGEKVCSLIKSGTMSDELNLIINNSRFSKKVLICTKAMDNGINIDDQKLKNIVIMTWDQISFIQMLGRKRIDIDNHEEVNLYIPKKYKKSFYSKRNIYNLKKAEIDLLQYNPTEFNNKYDNDLKNLNWLNDVFYRDNKSGDFKINMVGWKRLNEDIKFVEYMIEKFEKEGEYAFIREQLRWLGLEDQFSESNMIEEILIDDQVNTLEDYLRNLVGKELYKKEQKELQQFITKDFDNMISKLQGRHKRREPGYKIINKFILMCEIPYRINSYKKSRRVDGKVKSISFWKVELILDVT